MKKFLDFFLFSTLYISCCSVLMTYFTDQAFSLFLPSTAYLFIFAGTLSSYSFHWLFTKTGFPEDTEGARWSHQHKYLHLASLLMGGLASVYLIFLFGSHWHWMVLTAFITFLYSAPKLPIGIFKKLKRLAIAKTVFLALMWTHVTCILPFILSDSLIDTQAILYVTGRFFFIYAICILFDERDVEKDRSEGIKSMITYFDKKGVKTLFWSSLFIYFICIAILFSQGFSGLSSLILFLPLPLLVLYYFKWFNRNSDYHYYLFLDGFMMIPGILLLMLSI